MATEAASRAIDRYAGRQFGLLSSSEFRWYTAEWFHDRWIVEIDDLMTEASLTVEVDNDQDGTTEGAITAYRLNPVNNAAIGRPWTRIEVLPASAVKPNGVRHGVRIGARWGWTNVPQPIKLATLIQAARLYSRRANISGPLSSERVDDVSYTYGGAATELDSDVVGMVDPFRKPPWAAV
ncbi:hypothetical protein L2K20_10010 [Mycobacterium sp. MBM]|nr:hypothetical protein [Mycobacterium sp. MBM]